MEDVRKAHEITDQSYGVLRQELAQIQSKSDEEHAQATRGDHSASEWEARAQQRAEDTLATQRDATVELNQLKTAALQEIQQKAEIASAQEAAAQKQSLDY